MSLVKTDLNYTRQGKKKQFAVLHNSLPARTIQQAFTNWLVHTTDYTDADFCKYVESKEVGAVCLTVNDINQLHRQIGHAGQYQICFPDLSPQIPGDAQRAKNIIACLNTKTGMDLFDQTLHWVEFEQDWQVEQIMRELSSEFPSVLMQLDMDLPDYGLYRMYAWNGKVQYSEASIVFDAFDKTVLH